MGKTVHTDQSQYVSITEAAALLGVSRPSIYNLLRSGELPYNQLSKRIVRIRRADLLDIQSKMAHSPSAPKLSKTDLKDYITREEALKKYGIAKTKFHKAVSEAGLKSVRHGMTRKHICATAHKLGIAVKQAGTVCYIDKAGWDDRKLAPAVIEKNYLTADQAKKHYHIGASTFYDKINASNIEKVKRGNFMITFAA